MFNELKVVHFLSHSRLSLELQKYTAIWAANSLGKTGLLTALFFLSSGINVRSSKQTDLIQNEENYAVIESTFTNHNKEKITYKTLIEKTKITFFRNDQVTNLSTLSSELPVFFVNLSEVFFDDLFVQQKWLEHKISKKHPNYWSVKVKVDELITRFRELENQKNKTILETEEETQICLEIWRICFNWKTHINQLITEINQNLSKITRSFSTNFPLFEIEAIPLFTDKNNSFTEKEKIAIIIQILKNTTSLTRINYQLFFGQGIAIKLVNGERAKLSYREKINQQLFLEIVSALIFQKHTKLKPILLIDEFGILDSQTQTFIWKYKANFQQILVTAPTPRHFFQYNFGNQKTLDFLEIKEHEPSSTN